jgi:hypothetical protein
VDGGVLGTRLAGQERRIVPQWVTPRRLSQDHVGAEVSKKAGR